MRSPTNHPRQPRANPAPDPRSGRPQPPFRPSPRIHGLTLIEAVVVLAIVAVVALLILTAIPAMRETARSTSCQRHLMDVGTALTLYDNAMTHLPSVPEPDHQGDSPLAAMMAQLGVTRFGNLQLDQAGTLKPAPTPKPQRIPGLLCPSDNWVRDRDAPAPVTYRACSGSDLQGQTGAFPIGGAVSLSQVQNADGTAYTAAFAERLVGNGQNEPALNNYAIIDDVLIVKNPPADSWRGDSGSNWSQPGYVSTLYNHALEPAGFPSVVSSNGRSALLSTSSAHPGRVHVLRLDGSFLPISLTIDREVWRKLGTIDDSAKSKPPNPPQP